MTKLRDEVRGAFEKEQAMLGDVGGARHRLVHNTLAARDVPAPHGLHWVAGVAAVLIAAMVIATFLLVRAGSHSQVVPGATPSPKALVSPTPMTNALNVPDSTPVITFGDPAKPDQIDGITWDGKQSGVLPYQPVGLGNPANNLFASSTEIRDRKGKLVASGNFGAKSFMGTWADDEVHFCQMVPFDNPGAKGLPTTLQLVDARVGVVEVGTLYNQTSVSVAACSVVNDRAVVVQESSIGKAFKYWVVKLSTGTILWSRTPPADVDVIASRDGAYVVENASGPGGGAAGSNAYGPDGSEVTDAFSQVVDFSWNDALAVVTSERYGAGPEGRVTALVVGVANWRAGPGGYVWGAPTTYALQRGLAQPDGFRLAIWLTTLSPSSATSPTQPVLYVIAADGKVVAQVNGAT